ncbi:tRNA lysidine(34) synthetase TilS [Dokdonia sp. 4H-3-7-5]|uniref:tRNA lysidine(34) synthetase TilS n=1 Tax=Dokdonia sp. (strain 4H-3-7-5) TaxID=983548 RepID=UPI00020A6271|nr:tRNA lysidine(34) synthetase TilS [Dokdonia sp. 4H-3-7-5]AEE18333.1 tRNA(Ile)-lysidine synthetase [Dokdonia sp. 4H-3-7-5]
MLEDFKHHIAQDLPFLLDSKILVTVSGGLDSMLLLLLCRQAGLTMSVAHCNFNLRGVESDGDQVFVASYCTLHNIPIYIKGFDTSAYAKTSKTSTQIAARELRYQWFKELSVAEDFDYILTAHHLNDDLETFLINLGRGTGIKGLTGIPVVNGEIVRPLLKFSRKQIRNYALKEGLQWREDSSNGTDNYVRNHIRHHAIPNLEEAQPNILKGLQHTQEHLKQSERLLKVYTDQLRQQFMTVSNGDEVMDLVELASHPEPEAVLYQLLSPYGFTAWDDIYKLPQAQSGKEITSSTHRLLKNREKLIISVIKMETTRSYQWQQGEERIKGDFGILSVGEGPVVTSLSKKEIVVDASLIGYPLTIRKWKDGDYFYPYGMKGRKKLSKYLKDEKLSLIAKKKVWLLCSDNAVIWVIGHRADDRFKVVDTTLKTIKFTIV